MGNVLVCGEGKVLVGNVLVYGGSNVLVANVQVCGEVMFGWVMS